MAYTQLVPQGKKKNSRKVCQLHVLDQVPNIQLTHHRYKTPHCIMWSVCFDQRLDLQELIKQRGEASMALGQPDKLVFDSSLFSNHVRAFCQWSVPS